MGYSDRFMIKPGSKVRLAEFDPADSHGSEADAKAALETDKRRLHDLQELLYAEHSRALLVCLQGMDTSGKDGTIGHIFGAMNPQGCHVTSFKTPSAEELAHDFLWRVHRATPGKGEVGIFNRSHYEDVVAVRVRKLADESVWSKRYAHIVAFERLLIDEGTSVVKVFLHESKEVQRKRLQERVDDPEKRWKFRVGDLDDRAKWNEFRRAYEDAIRETSTHTAPWFVVPADHNWSRNLCVAEILVGALERLDPKVPPADPGVAGLVVP